MIFFIFLQLHVALNISITNKRHFISLPERQEHLTKGVFPENQNLVGRLLGFPS